MFSNMKLNHLVLLLSSTFTAGSFANVCSSDELIQINNYIYDVKNLSKSYHSADRIDEYHDYLTAMERYKKSTPEWNDKQALINAFSSSLILYPAFYQVSSVTHVKMQRAENQTSLTLKINRNETKGVDSLSVSLNPTNNKIIGALFYSDEKFESGDICKKELGIEYIQANKQMQPTPNNGSAE